MASLNLCVQTWKLLNRRFPNRLVNPEALNAMTRMLGSIERIYEAMPAAEKKIKAKKSSGKKILKSEH